MLKHPKQLLVTALTPRFDSGRLSRPRLARHLAELAELAGFSPIVPPSIAYSDRPGNGGFTGFVAGPQSHVDVHHWDMPNPGVLQFDVFSPAGTGEVSEEPVLEALKLFWDCTFVFAATVQRGTDEGTHLSELFGGDAQYELPETPGMGPGDHLHLFLTVEHLGDITAAYSDEDLKQVLVAIVEAVGMTVLIRPKIGRYEDDGNLYLSGLVGITTSHISFHFARTQHGCLLHIDVFSCKPFEIQTVLSLVEHEFSCRVSSATSVTRYPRGRIRDLLVAGSK